MTDISTPTSPANGTSMDSTKDKASTAAKDLKSAAGELKTVAGEVLETTKAEVKARAETATKEAQRIYADTKTQAQDKLTEFEAVVRERPLVSVIAAVAVGLVLGSYISAQQPKTIYLRDRR